MTKTNPPCSKKWFALGCALSVAALALHTSHAQSTWTGDVDQDWNNENNWSDNTLPPGVEGDGDSNVIVNTATGNFPIISADSGFTPNDLIVGAGAGESGLLDHRAGEFNVFNWSFLGNDGSEGMYNLADTSDTGGTHTGFAQGSGSFTSLNNGSFYLGGADWMDGGTGTLNMNTTGSFSVGYLTLGQHEGSSGTLNLDSGTVNVEGELRAGGIGSGEFNQSGGTVNVGGALRLGVNTNNAQSGTGTWNVSGADSTVNVEGDLVLGFAGDSDASGSMTISDGATVNVGTDTSRWIHVNRWDPASGEITVDGGALNMNTNTDLRFSTGNQGSVGTNVVTLNSGTITSYSDNLVSADGAGVVDMNHASGADVDNTFNLNGGTLTIRRVISNANEGTRTFNFNGGTLQATGDATGLGNDAFLHLGGGGEPRVNVRDGGAIIDTNGFNLRIAQELQHSNIDGDAAIDGGLTLLGGGTLELAGANTFNGPTNIDDGTLLLTGSLGDTLVTVADGSAFGGSGTLGGDLHFGLGASFYFNPFDTLVVDGEITFDGFSIDDVIGLDDTVAAGTYTLIDGNVNFANVSNLGEENAFDLGEGVIAYFQSGSLELVVVPEPSTYALIFGALALAGVVARRRLRKA